MKRSLILLILAGYLLAGSVIFPLGDFSLMRDIPGMYHSYCSVKAGEPDVADFVGDYLLGGKDLLGHNAHDAQPKANGSLQFQHQPNNSLFFNTHVYELTFVLRAPCIKHPVHQIFFQTSAFQNQLFRPPLA